MFSIGKSIEEKKKMDLKDKKRKLKHITDSRQISENK